MNNVVRFENNVPLSLAFAYERGRETKGQYGPQFFRKTVDGKGVYLPPFVEDRLNELKLRTGEPVAIVKRKTQSGEVRWEVERIPGQPGMAPQNSTASQKAAPKPAAPVFQEGAKPSNGQPAKPTNGPSPVSQLLDKSSSIDNPYLDQRRPPARLEAALKTAVSAAAEAEKHGREIGYNVRFSPADIRALGISAFISMGGRSAA